MGFLREVLPAWRPVLLKQPPLPQPCSAQEVARARRAMLQEQQVIQQQTGVAFIHCHLTGCLWSATGLNVDHAFALLTAHCTAVHQGQASA